MPEPNSLNPICNICGAFTTLNKTLPSGARQYRCRRHKPNWTCTDSDRPVGGQVKGAKKLTQAERNARWKERDPIGYAESQKRRNARRKNSLNND